MSGKQIENWTTYLGIVPERHHVISLVGAGGKTTLIFTLAKELKEAGFRVAVTTTTHMQEETRDGITPVGVPCGGGKISGVSEEMLEHLREDYDVVLVEADGSHRLPFKVPSASEPALPKYTDLVIGVAGASAIGQPFGAVCHRLEQAIDCLGVTRGTTVTEEHLLEVLNAPWGQRKNVVCDYQYVINQVDLLDEKRQSMLYNIQDKYENKGTLISLKESYAL